MTVHVPSQGPTRPPLPGHVRYVTEAYDIDADGGINPQPPFAARRSVAAHSEDARSRVWAMFTAVPRQGVR